MRFVAGRDARCDLVEIAPLMQRRSRSVQRRLYPARPREDCESPAGQPGGSEASPQPFTPPAVRPLTTRSWNSAIRIAIGTIATISAAEMIGHGKANSPW